MKRKLNNEMVRNAMERTGTYLYEVAKLAGVSEPTMVRWMRDELPQEKQTELVSLIEEAFTTKGKA